MLQELLKIVIFMRGRIHFFAFYFPENVSHCRVGIFNITTNLVPRVRSLAYRDRGYITTEAYASDHYLLISIVPVTISTFSAISPPKKGINQMTLTKSF